MPTCKPLVKYVERELLQNVKRIEKQDFRLLIHLIANVCLHDFGSDSFHREFVSLDNLKKLAGVQNLEYIKSKDLLLLIEGLCKLTR